MEHGNIFANLEIAGEEHFEDLLRLNHLRIERID